MSYSWLKLHHDVISDFRMRKFSPQEKWAYVVLMVLASSNEAERGTVVGDDEDLADHCEFNTVQDWLYYKDKLKAKGMIDILQGRIRIINWESRQGKNPSDSTEATRERKRKQRAQKTVKTEAQNPDSVVETLICHDMSRGCHDNVTTQTRSDQKRPEEIRQEETTQESDRTIVRGVSEISGPESGQKEKTPYNLDGFGGAKAVLKHYELEHLIADGRREGSSSQASLPNWGEQIQTGVTVLAGAGSLGSTYKASPLTERHRIFAYLDGLFFGLKKKDEAGVEYLRSISKLEAAYSAGEMALEAKKAVEARESTQRPFRVVSALEKLESDLEQAEKERTDLNAEGSNPPGWLNRRIKDLSEAIEAEKNSSQGSVAA